MAEEPKPEETAAPIVETAPITSTETPVAENVDELKQKLAKFEFKEKLTEVSKTYPHVTEFETDIEAKVKEGYSIEDASVIILNKNQKLETAEQIQRNTNRGSSGFGGTMDTPALRDAKVPQPGEPGAVEYWANKVKELEAKGEIRQV